ncbi:MAG: transporter substrate-binding domain-containing protein [Saccharofermentans sp.]|nr:transporter substrate-binding domain-containing protein [Saccharofermentans sp.]
MLVALVAGISFPLAVSAEESSRKTVRVGCHEAPYFIKDKNGRLSGYSYEYQRKIAAYTGWKYEYAERTRSSRQRRCGLRHHQQLPLQQHFQTVRYAASVNGLYRRRNGLLLRRTCGRYDTLFHRLKDNRRRSVLCCPFRPYLLFG